MRCHICGVELTFDGEIDECRPKEEPDVRE